MTPRSFWTREFLRRRLYVHANGRRAEITVGAIVSALVGTVVATTLKTIDKPRSDHGDEHNNTRIALSETASGSHSTDH